MRFYLSIILVLTLFQACQQKNNDTVLIANFTNEAPKIDADFNEDLWQIGNWNPIEHVWLGNEMSDGDFTGRYKVRWNDSALFLAVEIMDDKLFINPGNPVEGYWNYDCLEVFIDANNSESIHQFNHSAWAYHISPDLDIVDIGIDSVPHLYQNHLKVAFKAVDANTYHWELAIQNMQALNNKEELFAAKNYNEGIMGFSLAYCDNDTSATRENFIGSVLTQGHLDDMGWIDAACFGKLDLQR